MADKALQAELAMRAFNEVFRLACGRFFLTLPLVTEV